MIGYVITVFGKPCDLLQLLVAEERLEVETSGELSEDLRVPFEAQLSGAVIRDREGACFGIVEGEVSPLDSNELRAVRPEDDNVVDADC